jgi:N-methylhydantoinase A
MAASPALAAAAPATTRAAFFAELGGFVPTPVYHWDGLGLGHEAPGPAIIEGQDSTIVVPPAFVAELDQWRNVLLTPAP